jgi:hypothetical protein
MWRAGGVANFRVSALAATVAANRSTRIDQSRTRTHLQWSAVSQPDSGLPPDGAFPSAADIMSKIAQVGAGSGDPMQLITTTQALVRAGLLDGGDDPSYWDLRESLTAAIVDLVMADTRQAMWDDAMLTLAALDEGKATTVCYQLFALSRASSHGPAGRLLARLTDVSYRSTQTLVEILASCDNFRGVLTSRALAERGATAVPALHTALRALPVPSVPDSPTWFAEETAKYRIMKALQWLGPLAEPTVPLLIALLEDQEGYRDTRHQAEVTLRATGRPAAAALVARLEQCLQETSPQPYEDTYDDEAGTRIYALVHALSGMPLTALLDLPGLDEALERLRTEVTDGLIDLIRDKLAPDPLGPAIGREW